MLQLGQAKIDVPGPNFRSRQEAKLDSEIDALLEPDVTNDSIMDDELEESDDEDEVNSILASDEDEP